MLIQRIENLGFSGDEKVEQSDSELLKTHELKSEQQLDTHGVMYLYLVDGSVVRVSTSEWAGVEIYTPKSTVPDNITNGA